MHNTQNSNRTLSHHQLRVYRVALEMARLVGRHPLKRRELRVQVERAMDSVILNIAEGAGLEGRRGKAHFLIARGSVLEVVAAYELADAYGERVPLEELTEYGRSVAAMLTKLGR